MPKTLSNRNINCRAAHNGNESIKGADNNVQQWRARWGLWRPQTQQPVTPSISALPQHESDSGHRNLPLIFWLSTLLLLSDVLWWPSFARRGVTILKQHASVTTVIWFPSYNCAWRFFYSPFFVNPMKILGRFPSVLGNQTFLVLLIC